MSKIVVDGEEVELTKEVLNELSKKLERENLFNVEDGESAYYIASGGGVNSSHVWNENEINILIPCKNELLTREQARSERLSRLLWKFANENNDVPTDEDWANNDMIKYYIAYNAKDNDYYIGNSFIYRIASVQHFNTKEICLKAAKEIVMPFIHGEID